LSPHKATNRFPSRVVRLSVETPVKVRLQSPGGAT